MLDSITRTVVPLIVAVVLGQAARIGLHLDEGAVTSIVTAVLGALYYVAARFVERHWPTMGRILVSAGLSRKTPTYTRDRQRLAA